MTTIWYFTGISGYSNTLKPDDKYGLYSFDLVPSAEGQHNIDKSQIQVKPREGTYRFKRQPSKLVKGRMIEFGPPEVFLKDGTKYDNYVPKGVEVTVKVVTYETDKGVGHRLESVRIDDPNFKPRPKPVIANDIDIPF